MFSGLHQPFPCLLSDQDVGVETPETEGDTSGEGRKESPLLPRLEQLWAFSCALTAGHEVSCMAWNKQSQVSPRPQDTLQTTLTKGFGPR